MMEQPIENPIIFEADGYYDNDNRTPDQMENAGLWQEVERLQADNAALRDRLEAAEKVIRPLAKHAPFWHGYDGHVFSSKKAHNAVAHAVRNGDIPQVNTQRCMMCGIPAKQYHHHLGYEPEHWLDVVPCCVPCHKKLG